MRVMRGSRDGSPDDVLRVARSWQADCRWRPGEDGSRIYELRAEGKSMRDIAIAVGCSASTVANRLRLTSQT